jgi:flagellar biosynthesis/type III secretory pathway protein FliH
MSEQGMAPLLALLGSRPAGRDPSAKARDREKAAAAMSARVEAAVTEAVEKAVMARDAHWQQLLRAREAALSAEVRAAEARAEALVAAAAQTLAELMLAGLKALHGTDQPAGAELLDSLAEEAIAALSDHGSGTLRMAPTDLAHADPTLPEGWTLVADASVPAGEVHATVGATQAIATLEHRLTMLATMLRSAGCE